MVKLYKIVLYTKREVDRLEYFQRISRNTANLEHSVKIRSSLVTHLTKVSALK